MLHLPFLVVLKLLAVTLLQLMLLLMIVLLVSFKSNLQIRNLYGTEVRKFVTPKEGFLIVDDTVLDKPYSEKIGFVRHQWSGKHHRTVKGIGLITLLWTDGNKILPIDFRIYNIEEDNKTKNDHFLDMLDKAEERGFKPKYVMFDIWYASVKNLKAIRKKQWHFLTRLKSNRLVNPDNTKNMRLETVEIPPEGIVVHLKEYGFIKVFRIVPTDGGHAILGYRRT